MSAESPRHAVRGAGPLTVPSQPPSDRSIIDAVSGFINDVTLSSASAPDPKDTIQWARFETADINEPAADGDSSEISPLLLTLGYGAGVQVWLIPPNGEAQEVLSWRQGTVRVLRILPTPVYGDSFGSKRPLIALCDSASPGPSFCSLSFISIRGGEQVKSIKFKNPILDVLANKRSVVVSFSERFAVFDAGTLEDRMAVTTCYPCPCPLGGSAPVNPLALGDRWLAYADKKINPSKRSSGGCEGEGVASYTATVLHAAKSLGKGLRGLGESVAQSLAGGRGASPPHPDMNQPGVLTVIDIEGNTDDEAQDNENAYDPIVAHFVAHSDAIIALQFDLSGMLLVTADRRGHDFHVFRVNPHPCGPALASVHHLYVLHRGDTTAKVQDISISPDSRWCAISTLRGTTHLFPISPYGGACGVRTHTQPRVVNRLSRFHRSAGLPIPATPPRSGSPLSHTVGEGMSQGAWFPNPRLPPYPLPSTIAPLAQLRPTANIPTHTITRNSSGRQRLSSLSESDSNNAPLLARARFGLAASPPVGSPRAPAHLALYLMAANGCLLHLVLHPRSARSVPKEKICDESPIELDVEPVAQWPLQRPPLHTELLAPLPSSNPLLLPVSCRRYSDMCVSEEERWLSQVEIVTHAGPHRRLWMGPQFVFKTYTSTGSSSSLSEADTVEVETNVAAGVARSNPVNMPGVRPIVPVLIDSGSASSLEHSPSDSCRRKSLPAESRAASVCDVQLREDLAEAMKEEQGCGALARGSGEKPERATVSRAVDQLGTVVEPGPGAVPPPVDDPDLYTHSNDDEACFRPVVRAPAALPPHPDLVVRPLPLDTRIPVQSLTPTQQLTPPDEPRPLHSDVVIPAALRHHCALPDSEGNVHNVEPTLNLELTLERKHVNQDLKREETNVNECERASERQSAEPDVGSLPKSNRPDDIQPAARVKKSPTPKLLSDRESSDSSKSAKLKERAEDKDKPTPVDAKQTKVVNKDEVKQAKITKPQDYDNKQTKSSKTDKVKPANDDITEEAKPEFKPIKEVKQTTEIVKDDVKQYKPSKEINKPKEDIKEPVKETKGEESAVAVTLKIPTKVKETTPKRVIETPVSKRVEDDIKTEEQAWDLLLNETETPQLANVVQQPAIAEKSTEETKTKSKRNRKNRKTQDDAANKADEDSFVEIHNIEKSQVSTGDLVSISSPYEDTEASRQYFSKRKLRSPKSGTPEIQTDEKEDLSKPDSFFNIAPRECAVESPFRKAISAADYDSHDDIGVLIEPSPQLTDKELFESFDNVQIKHKEGTTCESTSFFATESLSTKSKKSKSLSPYLDSNRKLAEKQRQGIDQKDLIIIDSTAESFPEIQITKVNKNRKKSPQPIDKKPEIKEPLLEKPAVKSWSSIAASKSAKKAPEAAEKKERFDEMCVLNEPKSSKESSLQDKLFEICKRTDIMVAECDTPAELNFVDEHHTMHDLPPLEPLEFALDDFRMEAMRDSLLDVHDGNITSPICKINIDDILSSIKETTSKVIESSTFNLVDLEKVPMKRERGFSVVESDKITTQEIDIKLEEEKQEESEIMEKSSDDDNTSPILSTDSDKDDKKAIGASNSVQPLAKQSAKSKKSRRKKK